MTHVHQPTPADQLAAVTIAVAGLTLNHEAAVEVAQGRCPVCLALAVTAYWINVGAILIDGNPTGLVSETAQRRMLTAADGALAAMAAEGSPN